MWVAPRAGAWIETGKKEDEHPHFAAVAPRAGAWIETICGCNLVMRNNTVAPRAGAWIETQLEGFLIGG